MADRYRVTSQGVEDRGPGFSITYPAHAEDRKRVAKAGGFSKLSEVDQRAIVFKTVQAGDACDDMPTQALEVYLARGWVELVPPKKERT